MTKTITSPVKRYPGEVVLPDFLTLPQLIAFEKAIAAAEALRESGTMAEHRYALLPGLCACVSEWRLMDARTGADLGALTADTFPASPRDAAANLMTWLIGEIAAMNRDDEDDRPNA
jgi:hypothetical protein